MPLLSNSRKYNKPLTADNFNSNRGCGDLIAGIFGKIIVATFLVLVCYGGYIFVGLILTMGAK